MTVSPMLQLDQIIVRYGAIMAVQGVSCEVREGEIIVLLGANGAGKSSLCQKWGRQILLAKSSEMTVVHNDITNRIYEIPT